MSNQPADHSEAAPEAKQQRHWGLCAAVGGSGLVLFVLTCILFISARGVLDEKWQRITIVIATLFGGVLGLGMNVLAILNWRRREGAA
jgi:hypothetical protein